MDESLQVEIKKSLRYYYKGRRTFMVSSIKTAEAVEGGEKTASVILLLHL